MEVILNSVFPQICFEEDEVMNYQISIDVHIHLSILGQNLNIDIVFN